MLPALPLWPTLLGARNQLIHGGAGNRDLPVDAIQINLIGMALPASTYVMLDIPNGGSVRSS